MDEAVFSGVKCAVSRVFQRLQAHASCFVMGEARCNDLHLFWRRCPRMPPWLASYKLYWYCSLLNIQSLIFHLLESTCPTKVSHVLATSCLLNPISIMSLIQHINVIYFGTSKRPKSLWFVLWPKTEELTQPWGWNANTYYCPVHRNTDCFWFSFPTGMGNQTSAQSMATLHVPEAMLTYSARDTSFGRAVARGVTTWLNLYKLGMVFLQVPDGDLNGVTMGTITADSFSSLLVALISVLPTTGMWCYFVLFLLTVLSRGGEV